MKFLILFFFLILLSCSNNKVVKNHGITGLESKTNKIIVSKSNKNDVLKIIGKPSTISLFDENSWFFIEREQVNQSVFKLGKTKLTKNNVLEVRFNNYGIVSAKRIYNLENMNDYKIVKETTQKKYDKTSPIGKVLKSIEQKINNPTTKRKK